LGAGRGTGRNPGGCCCFGGAHVAFLAARFCTTISNSASPRLSSSEEESLSASHAASSTSQRYAPGESLPLDSDLPSEADGMKVAGCSGGKLDNSSIDTRETLSKRSSSGYCCCLATSGRPTTREELAASAGKLGPLADSCETAASVNSDADVATGPGGWPTLLPRRVIRPNKLARRRGTGRDDDVDVAAGGLPPRRSPNRLPRR
jgi:hypothetical protein